MKHQGLSRYTTGGRKVALKQPIFIAEVPLTGHEEDEGKIVGRAKIEKMPGGAIVAHIDASRMSAETLRRGFSLGSYTIPEEPRVRLEKIRD